MAEHDLSVLLKTLTVSRHEGVWAFEVCAEPGDLDRAAMAFREAEGWTLIQPATEATLADNRWAWLELAVFSDLNAVGFLAVVADALAKADVPCNAVAAFHHDHIFVPIAKADAAIAALTDLSKGS